VTRVLVLVLVLEGQVLVLVLVLVALVLATSLEDAPLHSETCSTRSVQGQSIKIGMGNSAEHMEQLLSQSTWSSCCLEYIECSIEQLVGSGCSPGVHRAAVMEDMEHHIESSTWSTSFLRAHRSALLGHILRGTWNKWSKYCKHTNTSLLSLLCRMVLTEEEEEGSA